MLMTEPKTLQFKNKKAQVTQRELATAVIV